jgi:thiol-disulfide isomerase/thioredoxin
MSKKDKINLIVNVTLILTILLFLSVIVYRYLPRFSESAYKSPAVGSEFPLPDTAWAQSPKTLVLILSKNCIYCRESVPFYRRLESAAKDVRLIAVFPGKLEEGRDFLAEQNINVSEINGTEIGKEFPYTPTLVIVDSNGKILASWVGMINAADEADVLDKIKK